MYRKFETELAGRPLVVETGKVAELANGNAIIHYGDTVVMVNATASKEPREGIDFFPLSVDYEEKLYSVGKIPGSFQKREGKPADKAILTSRAIDRPIRPLFPKDFRNDVCVVATVLSVEQDNSPEVCAMIGASVALSISDIPFGGPTAAVNVGYVDDKIVINPTAEQRERSRLRLTVAGTMEKVTMIEAGADEIPNDTMLECIKAGHEEIKKLCTFISEIKAEVGKPKFEYISFATNADVFSEVKENFKERMYQDVQAQDKDTRDANMDAIATDIQTYFTEKYGEEWIEEHASDIAASIHDLEKECVREMIFKEHKRPDGRKIDEIRPLSCEVGVLPRVHGSAIFTRGQTQVLSVVTLGTKSEEQELDGLDEEESKRYMHQYNFPSYSVGEARPSRGPGRREIGHGALAEKALVPVIPSEEEFPYTIRVVSEILESNGSSSQASICAGCLSLMAAGVPIKAPVAGIAMGLITKGKKYTILTDIQGLEDHMGDMDFKVAGTRKGITALQMDIKIKGVTKAILKEALEQAKKARMQILDLMESVIAEPRKELSPYAPKIKMMNIDPEKIKDVIGRGGEMITKIILECSPEGVKTVSDKDAVKIDIEDDGRVIVYHTNQEVIEKTMERIEQIVREVEDGKIYNGKVTKVEDFGCFVELWPGCEGLVHVSQLDKERVNKPSDIVKVGDEIVVKSLGYDNRGRLNLSRKEALFGSEKKKSSKEEVKENKEEKTEKKSRKGLFRKGE